MEEAPKIERLISSRGITLSDAANILSSYVAIIDSAAAPHKTSPAFDNNDNDASSPDTTNQANNHSTESTILSPQQRQEQNDERETGRLLAKLNQLDPASSNNRYFGGSISDDVYERLHMIMKSMVGEAEGKPVSAVKVYNNSSSNNVESSEAADAEKEQSGEQLEENHGEAAFMKELEEAEQQQLLVEPTDDDDKSPEGETSQSMQHVDYEQKKKDKKAKKAAKKAKKEAKKRKVSVGGATEEKKRIRVEED